MKSVLLGSLLASIAMFIWGSIYWMNPLVSEGVMKTAPDDSAAQAALTQAFPESGVYYVPGNMEDAERFNALHEKGPLALVQIIQEGKPAMSPMVFLWGWLHMLGACLLAATLLCRSTALGAAYWTRVGWVTMIGLLIGFFSEIGAMVWFYQPLAYTLFQWGYAIGAFFVAGLVLAVFLKVKPAA